MSIRIDNNNHTYEDESQKQLQGQGQVQQQQIIVNIHTGEKTVKGKKNVKGSIHNTPSKKNPVARGQRSSHDRTQAANSNNKTLTGDNINVYGNGNITTGRINNSTVTIGNGNTINSTSKKEPVLDPDQSPDPNKTQKPKTKPSISKADAQVGKTLALRLHAETTSIYANNGNIANVFGAVNNKNAYSFFKEYAKLARKDQDLNTTGAMHDSFDVWDTFNNINIKITTPALVALLQQASKLSDISKSDEFNNLETLVTLAKEKEQGIRAQIRTPDLSKAEAYKIDQAIVNLLNRMSKEYD